MNNQLIEKIELPKIYAWTSQSENVGPFYTTSSASKHFNLHVEAAANSIKSKSRCKGIQFYTAGTKEFVFVSPNIPEIKRQNLLIRATNSKPHTEDTLIKNLKICGYEYVKLEEIKGVKTMIEIRCSNVECKKTITRKYENLTRSNEYNAPRCIECQRLYRASSASNRSDSPRQREKRRKSVLASYYGIKLKFKSATEAHRKLKISYGSINYCLKNNKRHKKSGFYFEYISA